MKCSFVSVKTRTCAVSILSPLTHLRKHAPRFTHTEPSPISHHFFPCLATRARARATQGAAAPVPAAEEVREGRGGFFAGPGARLGRRCLQGAWKGSAEMAKGVLAFAAQSQTH